jgi:D-3-phosphoglycerate dehydrogenase / 2-oxoglutarate reductase
MSWKVLVTAPYFQPVVDEYRNVFEENDAAVVLPVVNERMSENELLDLVADIDGIICGDDQLTERVLQKAKKLKAISKWGTGIDSIDQVAAAELGITVCNFPGAFTDPVADSVLGYILSFARGIPWMDRDMRQGCWSKRMGTALYECTLGIIGVGAIGQAVARRARSFGMNILGYDVKQPPAAFIADTEIIMSSKDNLLSASDFVTLNCTLNSTSRHIVDGDALRRMQSTAYLINTARGPLVDEDALVSALNDKEIAGAALDVFEVEPLPTESSLLRLDNCLLAPHNSNSSPSSWAKVHERTLSNLFEAMGK